MLSEDMARPVAEGQSPCIPRAAPLIHQFESDTHVISVLTSLVRQGHVVMTEFNRLGMYSSSTAKGTKLEALN